MQEYSVKVTLPDGQVMAVTASESDTLEAVADRFKDYYEDDIILGIVNGRLRELNKKIKSDCELSFVTTADRDGRRTYRRSVVLLSQADNNSLLRANASHEAVSYCHIHRI